MLGQPLLGPATPRTPSGQARKRLIWDVTDSIDYHVFNNSVAHSRNTALREGRRRRRHIWGVSGRTFIAILTTLVSGVLIGITGKLMEEGVDGGVAWRNALIQPLLAQSITRGSLAMLGISIGFISVLVAAVQWLAPGAAGSGVSLVIAFLNGNNIAGLLTPATYLMKLLGPCLARTSGLVLGPEAPMIHLGACVSSIVFGLGRCEWHACCSLALTQASFRRGLSALCSLTLPSCFADFPRAVHGYKI